MLNNNSDALSKLADKLLDDRSLYDKLKEIGNKRNYPYKVQKLKQRLTEEYKFWVAKGGSSRLQDVERDVKYISGMLNKDVFSKEDKAKIDQLTQKYPI